MANVTLRAFAHSNGELEDLGTFALDTNNPDEMKEARERNKKSTTMLIPVLEDGTIDLDGVEALVKPGRRTGAEWTDEMVAYAHELRANSDVTFTKIMLSMYTELGVEVSEDQIKKVLKQEIYDHVELEEGLREKVIAKTPTKGGRKKYSDEVKEAVITDMENGMSGTKAAEKNGVSFVTANGWYRKKYGRRR